VAQCTEK